MKSEWTVEVPHPGHLQTTRELALEQRVRELERELVFLKREHRIFQYPDYGADIREPAVLYQPLPMHRYDVIADARTTRVSPSGGLHIMVRSHGTDHGSAENIGWSYAVSDPLEWGPRDANAMLPMIHLPLLEDLGSFYRKKQGPKT